MNWNTLLFVAILLSNYLVQSDKIRRLRKQNIRLKIKLSELAQKIGDDTYDEYIVSEDDKRKLRTLKMQNKKLDAIKLLHDNYKMGLVESKTYFDYL